MTKFDKKVDFAVLFTVRNANPNGDPLTGNRPRENYDGLGEVSDVCLKRKIRNRLQDAGEKLFVQSDDRSDDGLTNLTARANSVPALKKALAGKKEKEAHDIACNTWIDVRSFGQVFALKAEKKSDSTSEKGVSVGVRGPVSIHPAFSVGPVEIETIQITKSVNTEEKSGKASDTMGTKHRINFGLYVFYGSINCQLAEKTGFSQEDAEKIHEALRTLFENDASSARPDGSMEVRRVLWWQHNCASGQYPSAKVHRSLQVQPLVDTPAEYEDFRITVTPLPDLACQDEQFD
ncbi:MAG: type I-C CRISPR-associated protein Cas7/Csd2 [Christensenellales bacterium]|jgi:CRISPR-associated protein Csd2